MDNSVSTRNLGGILSVLSLASAVAASDFVSTRFDDDDTDTDDADDNSDDDDNDNDDDGRSYFGRSEAVDDVTTDFIFADFVGVALDDLLRPSSEFFRADDDLETPQPALYIMD